MLTDKFSIGYDSWIELDPHSLSVVCVSRANVVVCRVLCLSTGIPDGSLENPFVLGRRVVLQEYVLDSPETPSCKSSDFRCSFN